MTIKIPAEFTRLVAVVPGTPPFRAHIKRTARRLTRSQLSRLEQISVISDADRESLERRLRSHLVEVNVRDAVSRHFEYNLNVLLASVIVLSAVGAPFFSFWWMPIAMHGAQWASVLLYPPCLGTLALVAFLPQRFQPVRDRTLVRWSACSAAGLAAIIAEMGVNDANLAHNIYVFELVAAAVAVLTSLVSVAMVTVISGGVSYLMERVKAFRCPEAGICEDLFEVLFVVDRLGHPISLAFRREVMIGLESAARKFETHIPRRLTSGDATSDEWIRYQLRHIAAALRSWKREMLQASPIGVSELAVNLASALDAAVDCRYGSLVEAIGIEPGEENVERRAFNTTAKAIVAISVRALLPAALLVALQLTPAALEGSVRNYAAAAVVLWGVISLLSVLDPRYAEKVDAFVELGSFLGLPTRSRRDALEERATGRTKTRE